MRGVGLRGDFWKLAGVCASRAGCVALCRPLQHGSGQAHGGWVSSSSSSSVVHCSRLGLAVGLVAFFGGVAAAGCRCSRQRALRVSQLPALRRRLIARLSGVGAAGPCVPAQLSAAARRNDSATCLPGAPGPGPDGCAIATATLGSGVAACHTAHGQHSGLLRWFPPVSMMAKRSPQRKADTCSGTCLRHTCAPATPAAPAPSVFVACTKRHSSRDLISALTSPVCCMAQYLHALLSSPSTSSLLCVYNVACCRKHCDCIPPCDLSGTCSALQRGICCTLCGN